MKTRPVMVRVDEAEAAIAAAGEAMRAGAGADRDAARTVVPDPDFVEHEARVAAMAAAGPGGVGVMVGDVPPFQIEGDGFRTPPWAVPIELPAIRPWSKLGDDQLVTMLRGKVAGFEAQLAALGERRAALLREIDAVQAESLDVEVKADALRRTIEVFEDGEGAR